MPKTLGMFGTGLVTFMQNQIWRGAIKAAQEHDARLVFYPAVNLSSLPPFSPQAKVLFDLVDNRFVDGLLIWYAGVAEGVGITRAKSFFDHYETLPVVTIGGKVKNYPDLSVDNYHGVCAAVEHLIQVHHRRHIAIVRGPIGHPDADERYRAYAETLQAHNLPVNPEYIAQALFELQTGAQMATAAVAHWLQDLHLEVDAVVTGSDYMAIATVKAIESYGLRVPEDIAVVGFDDVDDSYANIPSITSVRQPFYNLGHQGIEMLLAVMEKQALPPQTIMPAQFMVRESCGCVAKSLSPANIATSTHLKSNTSRLNSLKELNTLARELNISLADVENLVSTFQGDIASRSSNQFLLLLKQHLIQAMKSDIDGAAWQNAITVLRRYVLSESKENIDPFGEALFNQARIFVTEVVQRARIRQKIRVERQIENLRQISEPLITSFGKTLLTDTLHTQLPQLGFPSFHLSLYDNPKQPAASAHLILACEQGQRIELPPDGLKHPTGQLPIERFSQKTGSWVVEPLYFRDEQLGILTLEVGPTEGAIYESLRAQVSSALQGSRLLQQVQQHTAQLEQNVTERTAELTQTVERLQIEISERQRAEKALRLASFAIEHVSDVIYWISPDGNIIDVNEAACRMLGYSREELLGKPLGVIEPLFKIELWSAVWENLKKSNMQRNETVHQTKDGRQIPVEVVANHIAFENKELDCAIVRDISHRIEAEQAIRQLNDDLELRVNERTRQLETVNSELEAFAYSVSHDLRTPLRAMEGYAHILIEEHRVALPEEAQHYLHRIQHNAQRMGHLIDDLLALSRIGRNPLHMEAVDMNQLIHEVLGDLRADSELKQTEITVAPVPACKADRSLLKQVWVNLISNAVKYSSKCERPQMEIGYQVQNQNVIYFVKDNGIGFAMQYVNKLFGVFQRLHNLDEYEGTGIGLAIVHRIVRRHGGEVWAESEVNQGATFYFTIGEGN